MSRFTSAALAALAAGALAACSEPISPDRLLSDEPGALLAANKVASDLPVLRSARSHRVEPVGFPADKFDVTVRFAVPVTDAQRAAFETAAARWQGIINKDVPAVSGTIPANACFPGMPAFSGTIDDILIDVQLVEIDGPGQILGAAGACFIRTVDGLPVYGIMYFDVADLAFLESYDLLDETVVHEMGHVIGLSGSFWSRFGLRSAAPDYRFLGKFGNLQYGEAGGVGLLPIEDMYGAGTRGSHWREGVLNNELMTGFLNLGYNPLSRITAGALRDMGYGTNMAAEDYTLPMLAGAASQEATSASQTALVEGIDLANSELIHAPIGQIAEEQ